MAGASELQVGGRYRLIELVGQGGMGRVWRGHDELLDREVALKEVSLPQSPLADDSDQLIARTMREAQAAARLNHPNIVDVYDAVQEGNAPWIVMEFVYGPSLGDVLADAGPLDWTQVAAVGADLTDALAHAHALGVVHRDLKPDNVLLADHRAVITDWGIARVLDESARLTPSGMRIGTPQFLSPEHIEGSPAEAPGDLWALGATLYTAVEGHPPFDRPTLTAVVAAILTQPVPPPQHAGPLAPLLGALLAKAPEQRPDARTAAESLANLLAAPTDEPATLPMRTPTTPAEDTLLRKRAGRSESGVGRAGTVRWKTRVGGSGDFSVVVSGGSVYINSDNGRARAFDATTGQERWSTKIGFRVGTHSSLGVSGWKIYLGGDDHRVYALDAATGEKLWRTKIGGHVRGAPTVSNGMVFVGSDDGCVYALTADEGEDFFSRETPGGWSHVSEDGRGWYETRSSVEPVLWRARTDGKIDASPAVSDGGVYIGSHDHYVYALDAADGQIRWRTPTGGAIHATPTVSDEVVYIGSRDHCAYALDAATGQIRWRTELGGEVDSLPAVSHGIVHTANHFGHVYALDAATGEIRWRTELGDQVDTSPAVSHGIVYTGSKDGHVLGLDALTGERHWHWQCPAGGQWRIRPSHRFRSSPAVSGWNIYIGCGRFVYALQAR